MTGTLIMMLGMSGDKVPDALNWTIASTTGTGNTMPVRSAGGVLGGLFTALIAPLVSHSLVARDGIEGGRIERALGGGNAAIHAARDGIAAVLVMQHGPPEGDDGEPGLR